ncbi:hypothetical protein AAFF_G00197400 [Aldrovandia affinis]|uniref:Ankyrin repeat and LEM domain-containing protein 2 n=1 Tax=Aldrovandia affinis TaxID=143900 RepID=A0AAD7RIX2_9TELE|nr:hypothetical protein AAFF_G00197400 [Aldrovandia affinis]
MDVVLERLTALSPDKLREEVMRNGLKCGPITATTRALFEKKLARAILQQQGWDSSAPCGPEQGDASPYGPQTGGEENNPTEEQAQTCGSTVEELSSQTDGQSPPTNTQGTPTLYYGVCPLWEEGSPRNDKVLVFVSKKEALKAVRLMKGARFKAFSSLHHAEEFSRGTCDYCPSLTKPAADGSTPPGAEAMSRERANTFQTPRTQDLTAKLRKAVEKGDQSAFNDLVWSNPRYLIGAGDNPTIVQEGCRYNVLHVAAKENRPEMARLVLETLQDPQFMRLMYPDDQESMLWERIRYLTDLYLNTPDKGSCETPLHFACKFGCSEVVNVLCSYPDTDKHGKNKYGQQPSSVICERKNKSKEVKQKIKGYLEDRYYIPLLRAADNSSQPVIGAPWSPEPLEPISDLLVPSLIGSPTDPVMEVRAFSGPFSPSKAEEFRRMWKTPPRDQAEHFCCILKSDPERGAERVGRELAHANGLPWAEYWEFLGCFVDLSSEEGLQKLDEYLTRKDFSEPETQTCNPFRTPSPGKSVSVGALLGEEADGREQVKRENSALSGPEHPPQCQKTPKEDQPHPKPPYTHPSPVLNLMAEFEQMSTEGPPQRLGQGVDPHIPSRSSGASLIPPNATHPSHLEPGISQRTSKRREVGAEVKEEVEEEEEVEDRCSLDSEEYLTADESSGEVLVRRHGLCSRSASWDSLNSTASSSSSYKSIENWQEDCALQTPPNCRKGLFINGDSPTRLDREVLAAMVDVEIPPQMYPGIQQWRSTMQLYPSSERHSWPSPVGVKSSAGVLLTLGKFSPTPYSPAHASFIHCTRHMHDSDYPV